MRIIFHKGLTGFMCTIIYFYYRVSDHTKRFDWAQNARSLTVNKFHRRMAYGARVAAAKTGNVFILTMAKSTLQEQHFLYFHDMTTIKIDQLSEMFNRDVQCHRFNEDAFMREAVQRRSNIVRRYCIAREKESLKETLSMAMESWINCCEKYSTSLRRLR